MRKHCAQPALPHHRKTYRSGIRGHRASPEREQEVAVVVFRYGSVRRGTSQRQEEAQTPHRRYARSQPHLSLLIRRRGAFFGEELLAPLRFPDSFLGRLSAIVVAAVACPSRRALTEIDRRSRYKRAKAIGACGSVPVEIACPISNSLAADRLSI